MSIPIYHLYYPYYQLNTWKVTDVTDVFQKLLEEPRSFNGDKGDAIPGLALTYDTIGLSPDFCS